MLPKPVGEMDAVTQAIRDRYHVTGTVDGPGTHDVTLSVGGQAFTTQVDVAERAGDAEGAATIDEHGHPDDRRAPRHRRSTPTPTHGGHGHRRPRRRRPTPPRRPPPPPSTDDATSSGMSRGARILIVLLALVAAAAFGTFFVLSQRAKSAAKVRRERAAAARAAASAERRGWR